jgi:putative transcriptional regulator
VLRLALVLAAIVSGAVALPAPGSIDGPGGPVSAPRPATAAEADVELAAGKLLVAKREMTDPNFAESVVLLLRYDLEGALGVIVNRRGDKRLSTLLPEIESLDGTRDTVFRGGPVTDGELFVLVRSGRPLDGAHPVFADFHVSQSRELLERLAAAPRGDTPFRVYAGYAGWAPFQLDYEVARGDWHIVPARGEVVFADRPAEVWQRLVPRDRRRNARTLPRSPRPDLPVVQTASQPLR